MTTNPSTRRVSRKLVELIGVLLNAACTNLNPDGTRRHIRRALDAGASRQEILMVLKCAALGSIHSCSLGAPILEEAKEAGAKPAQQGKGEPTPFCDKMRAIGQWNSAWDPFFELDPVWTDQFLRHRRRRLSEWRDAGQGTRIAEHRLRCVLHGHASPGTRRHIKGALKAGATMEEIMEVLKLCVVQGVQACNLGVPILAEELARAP